MERLSAVFGRVVWQRRESLGLSQEGLADLARLHRTYISSIERGRVRLGLDVAQRIASALGVPLSSLIAEAERPGQAGAETLCDASRRDAAHDAHH